MKNIVIILIIVIVIFLTTKKMSESEIKNIKLSENFTLGEFMHTNVLGFSNIPNKRQRENIQWLVTNVLQPLRGYLKQPIVITSGFRSPEINKQTGGAATSQHQEGEAADFVIEGVNNEDIISTIKRLGLPYDQLIDEVKYRSSTDREPSRWIHVSLKKDGNRFQVLKARNTPYDLKMKFSYYG